MHVDVHQHLWPEALVGELRRRSQPPRLESWTLLTASEAPFDVNPADHDAGRRAAQAACDGADRVIVGLSSPLGIEYLAPGEAEPLLDAYHRGVAELGAPFAGWAAACLTEIDPGGLAKQLDRGFAGLQLPATAVANEAGYRRCGPLLEVLAERDRPLFIHPGPVAGAVADPPWWAALVPYVQQLHAAWFAFRAYGRLAHPRLRVCFAALAGLAPLHGERLAARGGADQLARGVVDPGVFVETSSYGSRAVDAVVRVLGVDMLIFGSDRPYARPCPDHGLGSAARHAIGVTNPDRLLHSDPPPRRQDLIV
jgi:6-methylsalicylate decarboxylase